MKRVANMKTAGKGGNGAGPRSTGGENNPGPAGTTAAWDYLRGRLTTKEYALVADSIAACDSSLTQATYAFGIRRFVATHGPRLLTLTGQGLNEWVAGQRRLMPRSTLKVTLASLRCLFAHACAADGRLVSPFSNFRLQCPAVRDREAVEIKERILSPKQISTVLSRMEAAEAVDGHAVPGSTLFRFLALSGMRVSEALSLEIRDPARAGEAGYVNWVRREEDGRYLVRVLGKSRRLREFRLSGELSTFLDKVYPPETTKAGSLLFPVRGHRLSRHGAHWQAKNIARRFMQDFPGNMTARFSFHHLRHSLCSHLLCEAGVHPVHVARVMGHTPEILTRYYLHGVRDVFKDLKLVS